MYQFLLPVKGLAAGACALLVLVVFFSGLQLVILGTIGEYLGRLFLDHSQSPQYVVRYVEGAEAPAAPREGAGPG